MGGAGKAAAWGVGLALACVCVAVGLVYAGVLPLPGAAEAPPAVLVILSVPDESGNELARFAFEVSAQTVRALDTSAPVTVPGTSAQSPAQALTFGGGEAVSMALASQTDDRALPWILVPSAAWTSTVDQGGGIAVDLPAQVRAYRPGRLDVLEAGPATLSGDELLAVASAMDYLSHSEQARVREQLEAGMASQMSAVIDAARKQVAAGSATSSLNSAQLEAFAAER